MGKNLQRNLYQWAAIVTLQYRSINLDMFRRLPKPAIQSVQTSLSPRPARLILRNVCGLQPNFITFICKLVNQSKHPVSLNRKRSAFSCISRQHSQKLISTWSDIPCPHLNRPSLGSAMYIKNRVAGNCVLGILCKVPAARSASSGLPWRQGWAHPAKSSPQIKLEMGKGELTKNSYAPPGVFCTLSTGRNSLGGKVGFQRPHLMIPLLFHICRHYS